LSGKLARTRAHSACSGTALLKEATLRRTLIVTRAPKVTGFVAYQKRGYSLEAVGWAWVVAGVQALLSLYLLAMWVLTQFGQPFE
jgi:hypothetical protein